MQELGSAPYPFELFVSLGWIALFLLIGAVLRMKISLFQKYLIPGCMAGGLIGFLFVNSGITDFLGPFAPNFQSLEGIIYHIYNLTFVAMGFTFGGSKGTGKKKNAILAANTLRCSLSTTMMVYWQQTVGIMVIFLFNLFVGTQLLETAGLLVARGFSMGPGPAIAQGAAYEQAGFPGMVGLGLTYAALGYIVAIIVGIPVANIIMRKRGIVSNGVQASDEEKRGVYETETAPSGGKLTFMGTNIDTLSFHLGLLLLTYALAYLVMSFVATLLSPQTATMIWSLFASIFCLPLGLFVRVVFLNKVCKAGHLYDQGFHSRILNTMIDLVAVGALVGIQVSLLIEWMPIVIISAIITSFTTLFLYYTLTKKDAQFGEERLLGMLGVSTGTITSGLVLIRMIDPDYKSSVPFELSLMSIPSMIIVVSLLPITLPFGFAQVFYGKSWLYPISYSVGFFILFYIAAYVWGRVVDKKQRKMMEEQAS